MAELHDLNRFVSAQDPVYARVCAELKAGAKASHWMWFIFPQLRGLGRSAIAERYGITNRAEAAAYAQHPILGPRLRECTRLVVALPTRDVHEIFGTPDDLKFHSSMTLFAEVATTEDVYRQALVRFFEGKRDEATLRLLQGAEPAGPLRGLEDL
jgi:uncharacterized protein (DUF1810 family)